MEQQPLFSQQEQPKEQAPKHVWESFKLKRLPQFREGVEAFSYQDYSVYRAITNEAFLFGLATGTGKTLCSYMAYFYYKSKLPNTKLIIVTKKSAVLQYASELHKFFDVPELNVVAISKDMKKMYGMSGKDYAACRKQAYDGFGLPVGQLGSIDVLVFNYSVFRSDFQKGFFKAVQKGHKEGTHFFTIYDEATMYKGLTTQTFRCVEALSRWSHRRIAATATITKGKLEEVYAILKGIGVMPYANKQQFLDRHCITYRPPNAGDHAVKIVGYKNIGEFIERIKPFSIVLRKQDVAPFLPKFVSTQTHVDHSEEQFQLIKEIYSGFVDLSRFAEDAELIQPKEPQNEEEAAASLFQNEGVLMIQRLTEHGHIKRILCDPRVMTRANLKDYSIKSPKTQELLDALQDDYTDEKIVVYAQSRIYLELLANTIRKNKATPKHYKKVLEIHGGISGLQREQNKNLFQTSPDHNIILINDAGLEAINLQSGSTLCVMTMPNTAGDLIQLAGRISRVGSKHSSLSIRYFLTENSQDFDDYHTVQSQMLVSYLSQGESEEGLIDWEFLQSYYGVGRGALKQAITKEGLIEQSQGRLMLAQREKRSKWYV